MRHPWFLRALLFNYFGACICGRIGEHQHAFPLPRRHREPLVFFVLLFLALACVEVGVLLLLRARGVL